MGVCDGNSPISRGKEGPEVWLGFAGSPVVYARSDHWTIAACFRSAQKCPSPLLQATRRFYIVAVPALLERLVLLEAAAAKQQCRHAGSVCYRIQSA